MRSFHLLGITSLAAFATLLTSTAGCGSPDSNNPSDRQEGQSEFESAPPAGQSMGRGGSSSGGAESSDKNAGAPAAGSTGASGSVGERKVNETDLYRVVGDKLYYLNSYRGLMAFDIQDVNNPKLLGRAPIYGSPVEMIAFQNTATVVVGDWYGVDETGAPFHGSVIRTYDIQNPADMKMIGEARIKGWVRDARTVGNVIYTVSEDYGWSYGWAVAGDGAGGTVAVSPGGVGAGTGSKVVVSSTYFSLGKTQKMGERVYDGYQGAFNVTDKSIILAHDIPQDPSKPWGPPSGKTQVEYIDITDPNGTITPRGHFDVTGSFQGWGTDGGRWNVDFDGRYARVLTCGLGGGSYYCGSGGSMVLSTVDFQNLDAPVRTSELSIANPGWSVAARFDKNRLYLSPSQGYYYGGGSSTPKTPVQIYDTTDVSAPKLAGSTDITGAVWNFTPMGDKIFALGSDYAPGSGGPYDYGSSKVSLRYIDVADPKNPQIIGTSEFGEGWAWTPAAGTFKAFGLNKDLGMVVLPFSGWSNKSYEYTNGLQIIEFTPTSIATRGAAKTKGWVERGVYLKGRLLSLSDQALSVIDYTDRQNPKVLNELTLARNVVDARPNGGTMAQVSTDWWGYNQRESELRVLPIANAEENTIDPATLNVKLEGTNARVYRNGDLAYIVTDVFTPNASSPYGGGTMQPTVQVVDLAGGGATLRGKIKLPATSNSYWGYGWGGCYWYDWWDYSGVVQVQGNALAFRNMHYNYDPSTGKSTTTQTLHVVDIQNPDAPQVASVTVTKEPDWWWGNVRAVGDTLYTTHYEWKSYPKYNPVTGKIEEKGYVKYYLDQIDLSNRAAPVVGKRINVPGILVGASEADPSLLYFIDYRWDRDIQADDFAVARLQGDKVYLQSSTRIDGWVGNVFVRGDKAYFSAQEYNYSSSSGVSTSKVKLHELDIANPKAPVDRPSVAKGGWGWLLGVEGDRAVVTSGWGSNGVDIYKVGNGAPPTFSQFNRTRGWWANSLSRQGDTLYLASGYWGVQAIGLK